MSPSAPSPGVRADARRNLAPLPLVWTGALRDPSGYADEARSFLVALERAGRRAAARELTWTDKQAGVEGQTAEVLERAIARGRSTLADHVEVFHLVPHPSIQLPRRSAARVVRTMFETDAIPTSWLGVLLEADELWLPCAHNVETFAAGGVARSRIQLLPATIDFELFDPVHTEATRTDGTRGFTFLTSFDFTDRKGWDVLLDAWADAFDPDDDVSLVLKCLTLADSAEDIEARVAAYLGGRATAPIVFDTRLLPHHELPSLFAGADAFVLASRGEGWGRPYMEAMAMGLPTIGTRWSGQLEFMHDGNSELVDGRLVEVADGAQRHTPLYRGHRWFEVDRDALVEALRRVARGDEAVRARAAGARAELVEKFGAEAIAARLEELAYGAIERAAKPPFAVWRGDFGSRHSLAVVNDGVAGALDAREPLVRRVLPNAHELPTEAPGVASHWPPSFEAPSAGPYVLYQPWEYGRIPAGWVDEIRTRVDEVWTPSSASREAFVASGVPSELVHVVPNGVDLTRFAPGGGRFALPGDPAGTTFLFVGGAVLRKGIDLLVEAWRRAFSSGDDVRLVVKAFGAAGVYRDQTEVEAVEALASDPGAARVLLLDQDVPFTDLPALYRSADVLVQPYRGEGFCLPALEALACGVPVIVTAGGPTDDFAPESVAWPVASDVRELAPEALPPAYRLAPGGFLLEPRVDSLVAALHSAADPAARAAKAAHARAAAERYSWEQAAEIAAGRLRALAGRTPVRELPRADVPGRKGVLLASFVDWARRDSYAPVLGAYARAFDADADTTLVLPAADEELALALAVEALETEGLDPAALADVALADPGKLEAASLELAADAVVCPFGTRRPRARSVVPPDVAALRHVYTAAAARR